MKRILLLLMLVVNAMAADHTTLFYDANKAYEQKQYSQASEKYEQLLHEGGRSAPVLFNAGNSAFKQKRFGPAIAHYRQAALLAPRDPDVQANLRFARQTVGGREIESVMERFLRLLSLNELAVFTVIALWAWFAMLGLVQLRPAWKPALSGYTALAGITLIIFGLWLGAATVFTTQNKTAVVVVSETAVRLGPLEESQSSFTLRDGAEVQVLASRPGWVRIRTNNAKSGWLPDSAVQIISGIEG